MPYTYRYPRPAVTVDCVLFRFEGGRLETLLIRRASPPFEGCWALPGGFVEIEEDLEQAARRELEEETGLRGVRLDQFGVFGRPGRDPRGRTISVAWLGLVRGAKARARAGSDASEAAWWPARRSPAMAFDHDEILAGALGRLREKARRGPFGRELLPPRFTLEQLRSLYQCVLRRHVDGRRLCGVLRRVGHAVPVAGSSASRSRTGVSLYRFDRVTYNRLMRGGFLFTTESEGRKRT